MLGPILRQVLLAIALCASAAAQGQSPAGPSNAGAVVVIGPDVSLYARTVTGLELHADWSEAAHDNLRASLQRRFVAATRLYEFAEPASLMDGRTGQVLRLHARVSDAALFAQARRRGGGHRLWSVGPGAQTIADACHADLALLIEGDGAYASGARNAVSTAMDLQTMAAAASGNVLAAARLGVRALRGGGAGLRLRASLVDLRSGDIIWIKEIEAGDDDPRTAEGAANLVQALLEYAPL